MYNILAMGKTLKIIFLSCLILIGGATEKAYGKCSIKVGADLLIEDPNYQALLNGKRIGLISNQSAINGSFQTTFQLLRSNQKNYQIAALFAPEHGFFGDAYAYEKIVDRKLGEIPIYALHGDTRRPTAKMLQGIDLLIFDIQDIGSRSYTFLSTLLYCMEEAAKYKIPFLVLDRPNPMGGTIVDGPLMEEKWRSFIGYINVPYCHGMTIGELAKLFNEEYNINCQLTVVPMKGWKRGISYMETDLPWVPTSPQIPESDTPFFYPATGLIGHCSISSIGIGYTLPFKLVGAPWMDADKFAAFLNNQKLPGVYFQPFYFRPFFGKYKLENCQGVRIVVTDPLTFLPVSTQFTIMGAIKNLYPKQFEESIRNLLSSKNTRDVFNKLNGSEKILNIFTQEKYVIWNLRQICREDRERFLPVRKKYLNPKYS